MPGPLGFAADGSVIEKIAEQPVSTCGPGNELCSMSSAVGRLLGQLGKGSCQLAIKYRIDDALIISGFRGMLVATYRPPVSR